ncbi:M81 family metallopeptidase [Actinopolymorpha sp. B11F2]|uniref:M81 family metallopeptidase n=1 Tax=Actinopolymorpha sp. B11F2 TaxID=3160862 RepID=UPI0032E4A888
MSESTGTYRIGIAGMSTESSTFAPHRTTLADFRVGRGDELADRYPFLTDWRLPDGPEVEFVPLLQASALPGGQVLPEAYDSLEAELLDRLRAALDAGPMHGFYFDIHGAMAVEGRRDSEAGLAAKIRDLVGPACLMSASMDLHGQVSRELAGTVELLTAYRTAPHIDYVETRERAVRTLVHCLVQDVRPVRAWVRIPVLLPGEKTSTRVEPAQSIYASLADAERRDGVLDASLWVGYAWADEPRSAATVLVSGTDRSAVTGEATRLAQAWWDARDGFEFCAPAGPADWCIAQAFGSDRRPFFVSDSGDNPTAGGSNDVAWFLGQLLATPALVSGERSAIWASCVAPAAVRTCVDAGVGAEVDVRVGGEFGGGESVPLAGRVAHVQRDDRTGGDIAVVRTGGISAILTSRRKPFHHVADFTGLGLDPATHDLTAVKIGYLQPDLYRAARGWVLALTPGGVNQDLNGLDYQHVLRPVHPLDADLAEPDLTPVVFD